MALSLLQDREQLQTRMHFSLQSPNDSPLNITQKYLIKTQAFYIVKVEAQAKVVLHFNS